MNTDDLDRRLSDWIQHGPTGAPEDSIAAALGHARANPRRRDPLAALRRDPMGSSGGVALGLRLLPVLMALGLLLVAGLAVASIGGLFDRRSVVVPPVSPTSSPSVTVSPSSPTAPSQQVTTTPSPALEVSPSASVTGAAPFVLQRAPDNLGCDAIGGGPGYDSAILHIDPASDVYLVINSPAWDGTSDRVNVDVWAEVETPSGENPQPVGTRLAVYWSSTFTAVGGDTPVIRGPRGEEAARDGTRMDQEFTDRTGYGGCNSRDELYVLDHVPG